MSSHQTVAVMVFVFLCVCESAFGGTSKSPVIRARLAAYD